MENLIFGAFATLDGYREGDAANLGRTVYDRCTVVALCSAKAQNPACTVALLTNAPVPEPFRSQLTQGASRSGTARLPPTACPPTPIGHWPTTSSAPWRGCWKTATLPAR